MPSSHQDNVARGLKAAINNPNVSEEAKQRDAERLEEMGYNQTLVSGQTHLNAAHLDSVRTHQDNIVRGLKAAIHNPNVSEEAKQRDVQRLKEMGEDVSEYNVAVEDDGMSGHVLGGYKATLSNPRTSDAAKAHAQEVLEQHGA